MRFRLADSLDYIFAATGALIDIGREDAGRLVAAIRARRQSPHMFGAYYQLVLALEEEDHARARGLAAELLATGPAQGLDIFPLQRETKTRQQRLLEMLLSESTTCHPVDTQEFEESLARIEAALALLDRGFPELAAEIRALLCQIVLGAGPEDPKARTFDGASAYTLWGAVLLNSRGQDSVLDTAQALAHESGHNLLFGFCAHESLVDNPDEELFDSPLRADPRPMDGVFHATYVIARMHMTLSRLLEAGVLEPRQQEQAAKDLAAHRRNFAAGDDVIRKSGRLTQTGRAAIAAAREHMAAAQRASGSACHSRRDLC
ncbi:MAG: HEXXH motif-containing putative peptide modification protein [Sphingomonadaceae bacterium]